MTTKSIMRSRSFISSTGRTYHIDADGRAHRVMPDPQPALVEAVYGSLEAQPAVVQEQAATDRAMAAPLTRIERLDSLLEGLL